MHRTRRTILEHLNLAGTASVEDLATATSLAPVTMRHHLGLLRDQDLVDFRSRPAGRGRPKHEYHLTVRGKAVVVGDPHEALANRLVAAAKRWDSGAARALMTDVGDQIAAEHAGAEDSGLRDRLLVAARALSDEGFVVRWQTGGEGALHLIVTECPYESLREDHPEVCEMDQRVIERVMGVEVERAGWRLDGDSHCAYCVSPASMKRVAETTESL